MWRLLSTGTSIPEGVNGIQSKLKWLMLARVIFTALLLVSTLFLHLRNESAATATFISLLYLLIVAVFLLSLLYGLLTLHKTKHPILFAYVQIIIDACIVTVIVYTTGGFFSLFSFLYLVVIIYASIILFLKGGLFLALLCSAQYAIIVLLQYGAVLPSMGTTEYFTPSGQNWSPIFYKILITSAACFAVAILCGLLTEQNRKTQLELKAMEGHVKRVEKMAYMGEMAAGLAHEIKNPLASLVGSIHLLKEELHCDSDHQRLMDIILRETDRLGTLVNDFLFFARPPAGKPEKLNLKEAVDEITALFEKDITHARKFRLKKSIKGNVWVVMDPTHLRQILWNLLVNAAEAINDNGLIEIQTFIAKNNEIGIRIKDNGCGMAPEIAQAIFDPFYTTKPEGTGLGLSIVHRILEAYDSRLDVDTQEGSGTIFSFRLKQAGAV